MSAMGRTIDMLDEKVAEQEKRIKELQATLEDAISWIRGACNENKKLLAPAWFYREEAREKVKA